MTDNILLLQPFCTKAQFLNGKAKVDLIEKVAGMFAVITLSAVESFSLSSRALALVSSHFLSRSRDGALPSQAPDGGAESAALAVAPPGHIYPQRHHSWPGRQREGCYRQPVPSPLRPDGAQPDWLCCLPACQCPQKFKRGPEDLVLKVKQSPNTWNVGKEEHFNTDLTWSQRCSTFLIVPALLYQ